MARSSSRSSTRSSGGGKALGSLGEKAAAKRRGQADFLKIADGGTVVLRVLVDTMREAYVHRVQFTGSQGGTFDKDVPCLDQEDDGTPCPGCAELEGERANPRYKFYVWAIARDYVDPDLTNAKPKDTLVLWTGGIKLFRQLNKKHKQKGLQNRDIEVSREGVKLKTEYEVEWATERNEPLSAEDKALAAKAKPLDDRVEPPEFDEFFELPDRDDDKDDKEEAKKGRNRPSAFRDRNRRREEDEDEDDDAEDEDEAPRRKTSSRTSKSNKTNRPKGGLAAVKARKSEGDSSRGRRRSSR